MASVRTESLSPFSIYQDQNEIDSLVNEKSGDRNLDRLPEKCDIPLASIENDPFQPPSERRRTSGVTTTSISSFPSSDLSFAQKDDDDLIFTGQFSPMRNRPAFRNTSSVKAMQMSSPPPMSPISSPRMQRLTEYTTPSRRSQTPQSQSARSTRSNQQLQRNTPTTEPPKQHFPLILLHITLLPLTLPYSAHILELILPDWILENFRLLESRLEDSVLMGRGLLIPHPRHEYDLLEERILESLELVTPRILKSGHFNGKRSSVGSSFEPEYEGNDDERTERGGDSERGADDHEFDDLCGDCMLPMGLPNRGAGSGRQKWEVKVYAANGLMRSGAWGAAWSEMERVDVEVRPWIPPEFRRTLEMEVKRQNLALKTQMPQHAIAYGILTPPVSEPPHSRQQSSAEAILNEFNPSIPTSVKEEVLLSENDVPPQPAPRIYTAPLKVSLPYADAPQPTRNKNKDIPLSTALLNYFYLLSQDRRNIIMVGLALIVIFLCMRPANPTTQPPDAFESGAFTSMVASESHVNVQYVTLTATETIRETMTETSPASETLKTSSPEPDDVFVEKAPCRENDIQKPVEGVALSEGTPDLFLRTDAESSAADMDEESRKESTDRPLLSTFESQAPDFDGSAESALKAQRDVLSDTKTSSDDALREFSPSILFNVGGEQCPLEV